MGSTRCTMHILSSSGSSFLRWRWKKDRGEQNKMNATETWTEPWMLSNVKIISNNPFNQGINNWSCIVLAWSQQQQQQCIFCTGEVAPRGAYWCSGCIFCMGWHPLVLCSPTFFWLPPTWLRKCSNILRIKVHCRQNFFNFGQQQN